MSRPGPPISPDDIDIGALARAVWSWRRVMVVLTVATGLLTYGGLSFVTPLYTSQTDILIDGEDTFFRRPALDATDRDQIPDEHAVQSQVQILLSRDLAEAVARDLDLFDKPEFTGAPMLASVMERVAAAMGLTRASTRARDEQRVLDSFAERLSVFRVSTSRVIAIRFTSQDPDLAAQVGNRLARVYLTWRQRETLRQTREASDWLGRQIEDLRTQVEAAEADVAAFRGNTGLISGQNNVTLSSQELSELNSQLIVARAQRGEAEARARLIDEMLAETGDVDSASDVLRSELIQRLQEQRVQVQRRLAELSATLLSSHPRMQQLRAELSDLRQQIRDEARKVVRSLENEARIAGARETSLRANLEELKTQQARTGENEIKLRALEREAKANRDLLEAYLARHRDASTRRDELSVPAEASIISRAHAANSPSFPRKGPMTALAMAAVAMLSFASVLARELIAGQPAHGRRTAPAFPAQPDTGGARTGRALAHGGGGARESTSLGEIAEDIGARLDEGRGGRVLVAELDKGGASAAALDLARALAGEGRAVGLIELASESPGLPTRLALSAGPGIHDLAAGQARFDQIVLADPESTVQFVPAGRTRADMEALAPVLKALDATYDCLVLAADLATAREMAAASDGGNLAAVVICDTAAGDAAAWQRALAALGPARRGVDVIRYRPPHAGNGWVPARFSRQRQAAAV